MVMYEFFFFRFEVEMNSYKYRIEEIIYIKILIFNFINFIVFYNLNEIVIFMVEDIFMKYVYSIV